MSIRIILADDHSMLLNALTRSLKLESDFEIVGTVNNGIDAIKVTKNLCPDVVLMDIGLPELDGIEATRRIKKMSPNVKILMLTMHSSEKYLIRSFHAGASGYVLKDCEFETLVKAVKIVNDNQIYIAPSLSQTWTDYLKGLMARDLFSKKTDHYIQPQSAQDPFVPVLADIVGLFCHDLSNLITASRLTLSHPELGYNEKIKKSISNMTETSNIIEDLLSIPHSLNSCNWRV